MRITFLCPHLKVAGGVRAVLTYADRLAGRGHTVQLVVPAGGWLAARRAAWRHRGPEWIPRFRARVGWVSRWDPRRLPEADVLVATAWQSAPVVAEAAARCGVKFYFVQHYEALHHGAPETVDATYRLPLRKIVISTWLRGVMRDRFGSDAEVLVTPVDRELFHRVETAPGTPRPRVLMLYHDYAWKGVADGMEAVAHVRQCGSSLWLVGFGVKPPRGPAEFDEFHVDPPQPRLKLIYSGADIYLCPSWDEGLGMPAMEAMACGAALVTYDNGGCRDYARDGDTALVAPRREIGDLARQLHRLVLDASLRQRIATAGRALVTTAFDWEAATRRIEAVFSNA